MSRILEDSVSRAWEWLLMVGQVGMAVCFEATETRARQYSLAVAPGLRFWALVVSSTLAREAVFLVSLR